MVAFGKFALGSAALAGLTLAANAVYNYTKPKAKITCPKGSYLDKILLKIENLRAKLQTASGEEREEILAKLATLETRKDAKISSVLSLRKANELDKEQLIAFTQDFTKVIKSTLSKIDNQMKHFRQQGVQIPEEELESHIGAQLSLASTECYARHKCTEDVAKAAYEKFKGDKEMVELLEGLRSSFEQGLQRIAGADMGLPAGVALPPADLLQAMQDISTATVGTLKTVQEQLGPSADRATVLGLWQSKVQDVLAEVYSKYNLTEQLFELSIQKAIQTDPTFERKVKAIMAEQTLRLQEAGLADL